MRTGEEKEERKERTFYELEPRMKKKKETEMGKWFFDLGYQRKWFLRCFDFP